MIEDQERAGLLADPDEVAQFWFPGAWLASRSPIPRPCCCSAIISRGRKCGVCKVLSYVDDEAEGRGEPELAVLVVRQSDGLPGQGWWVGGAKKQASPVFGKDPSEALDLEAAKAGFRLLEGPGVDYSRQGTKSLRMDGGPQLKTHKVAEDDDGIRLDRWFKRHAPDISSISFALVAERAC